MKIVLDEAVTDILIILMNALQNAEPKAAVLEEWMP